MNETHNPLNGLRGRLEKAAPDLADQVARWRRSRMSWSNIARNLGRPEPDVRRTFDPTWKGRG